MKRAHDETDPYRRAPPGPPIGTSLAPLAPAPSFMGSSSSGLGQGPNPADGMGYGGMVGRGGPQSSGSANPVPQVAPAVSTSSQAYRQLNVRDAMRYLDQVKLQFDQQPDVYNQFLDIMKEFKAQVIDTPGVIQRVSSLFRGHRDLIEGFNTFLPPGFKIELPADDMSMITVHVEGSPQGSFQINPNAPMPLSMTSFRMQPAPPQNQFASAPPAAQMAAPSHPSSFGAATRRQPIEFNQAINYVNKIKTRFSSQPDIYKNFLEILHTYQREQKSIKEVYDQVAQLFRSHSDLLSEFSQFLPDTSSPSSSAQLLQPMGMGGVGGRGNAPPPSAPASAEHFMQPVRNRGKQAASKVKGRAGVAQLAQASGAGMGAGMGVGGKMRAPAGASAMYPPTAGSPYYAHKPGAVPQRPGAMGMGGMGASLVSTAMAAGAPAHQLDEIEFFDRVKRSLGNRQQYNEFLRCLNMFSQGILSKQELVELVGNFLSRHGDLFEWFKRFVNYHEPPAGSVPSDRRPLPEIPSVDYSKLRRLGSSYRALPRSMQQPKCSGRTDLCEEVLNNVWVSVPIWSEDAPFLASKKNVYEEAIYKAEDERYELDHVIEANLATIRVLEGLVRKMQTLTSDQQNRFRLGNNLGGTSEVIYHVAIRRAYGTHATEVINGLKRNPVVSVPVVLARLTQKDDEWRRGQREWNKIWRDIYTKNYFRALDYQGINFKGNDKKTLMSRALVQEAETLLQDQRKRAEGSLSARPLPQFEFEMGDADLHRDVLHIVSAHLEKVGGISNADKDKIDVFIHSFLARYLRLDAAKLPMSRQAQQAATGAADSDGMEVDVTSTGSVDPVPVRPTLDAAVDAARARNDAETLFASNVMYTFFRLYYFLYSRLGMVKQLGEQLKDNPHGARRLNTAARNLGLQHKLQEQPENGWYSFLLELIDRFVDGKLDAQRFEDTVRDVFGIQSYPLVTVDKLTHGLLKQMHNVVGDTVSRRLIGLYFSSYGMEAPSLFVVTNDELRESRDALDADADKDAETSASSRKKEERRRDESLRRRAGDRTDKDKDDDAMTDGAAASPALTSVASVAVGADGSASGEPRARMPNLRRPQLYSSSLQNDESASEIEAVREEVESIIGGENVFKIDFGGEARLLSIRLLPRPLSARWNQSEGMEARWSQYVDQYVRMERTAPELEPSSRVFLQRACRHRDEARDSTLIVANHLECKICMNTYKMFFVANTEDFLYRPQKALSVEEFKKMGEKRAEKWHRFLEGESGWKRGGEANGVDLSVGVSAAAPVAEVAAN